MLRLKLIELSNRKNINNMSLRAIGREIGATNAATVKYHLDKLKATGLLKEQSQQDFFNSWREKILISHESMVKIPILGSANCGPALFFADQMFEGSLNVSTQVLTTTNYDNLFAVRAEGDSMDLANIKGENVEEGDFLIIDTNRIDPANGDYVLSVIDGCANLKKFIKDDSQELIILVSESTKNYPPIFIHPSQSYLINGVVISVIKNPSHSKQHNMWHENPQ